MKQVIDELTLHAYLDGELNPAEAQEVEAALEADTKLAAQLEDLRSLFTNLEALPEVEYKSDASTAVLAQLHQKDSLPRFVRLALLGQAAFAGLVLALAWPFLQLFTNIVTPTLTYESIENTVQDATYQFSIFWSNFLASFENLVPQNTDIFAYIPDLALSNTLLLGLAAAATLVWFFGNGVVFTRLLQR